MTVTDSQMTASITKTSVIMGKNSKISGIANSNLYSYLCLPKSTSGCSQYFDFKKKKSTFEIYIWLSFSLISLAACLIGLSVPKVFILAA